MVRDAKSGQAWLICWVLPLQVLLCQEDQGFWAQIGCCHLLPKSPFCRTPCRKSARPQRSKREALARHAATLSPGASSMNLLLDEDFGSLPSVLCGGGGAGLGAHGTRVVATKATSRRHRPCRPCRPCRPRRLCRLCRLRPGSGPPAGLQPPSPLRHILLFAWGAGRTPMSSSQF